MAVIPYDTLEEVKGWSLRHLFERFVLQHPDVMDNWTNAINAYERVPFDLSFEDIVPMLPTVQWAVRLDAEILTQQIAQMADEPIRGRSELALWSLFTRYNALIDLLRAGFLRAQAVCSLSEKTIFVGSELWWSNLYVLDLEAGSIMIARPDGLFERYKALRVSRTSISPEILNGLSLSDAFLQMVLRDVGVRCAADRVEEKSLVDAGHAVMGIYWSGRKHHPFWWPVALANRGGPLPDGSQSNEALFVAAVADRFNQFLAPLVSGRVVATGLNLNDQLLEIPRTVWTEESTCIHCHAHSVGSLPDDGLLPVTTIDTRFRNIELAAKVEPSQIAGSSEPQSKFPSEQSVKADRANRSDAATSVQKKASNAEIDRLLKLEFKKSYRPKGKIIAEISDMSGASRRRVLHRWDEIAPIERRYPGRRKKNC